MAFKPVQIRFSERAGFTRAAEPVSFGVPLPSGEVFDSKGLALTDDSGSSLPFGTRILARWPDGSVRWMLVDTQVSVLHDGDKVLVLSGQPAPVCALPEIAVREISDGVTVETGRVVFRIGMNKNRFGVEWAQIDGSSEPGLGQAFLRLTDVEDRVWTSVVDRFDVEHDTPMKKIVTFWGHFVAAGTRHQLFSEIRAHFYAGLSRMRLDITVKNSKAAIHRGGAWDLGDPNSVRFKDLSFTMVPEKAKPIQACYSIHTGQPPVQCDKDVMIFQASSGGANWNSTNHVNSKKQITPPFRGYRIFQGGKEVGAGKRANPTLAIYAASFWLSIYCRQFWENFPKTMVIRSSEIRIGLFPGEYGDGFELQPGEQKTHTLYLALNREPLTPLEGASAPLVPVISSRHLFRGMTNPRPIDGHDSVYEGLLQKVIEGPSSFAAKNEIVDEYGWRNFGDVWADHESAYSDTPLISHYNNQYDLIKGMVMQFLRSGDQRWFNLARDMGNHVIDIDIYHTEQDKPQYNNGMFWHTDHHLDAATSTHRTISQEHEALKPPGGFGGGPAPDHNYATGLAYLYWLTGESMYRSAVLALAGNIIDCFNVPNSFAEMAVGLLKKLSAMIKNKGRSEGGSNSILRYDGPSRVSGNSLNTLMDAYLVSGEHQYLSQAEKLILFCVSPKDDFEKLALGDAENRWMYTVFLLALGRYLDIKHQFRHTDAYFFYARAVLLRYAQWMAENEHPYLYEPEKLEYPTETWAAQDIRKADIFAYAAGHADGEQRTLFMEKSRFFYNYSLDQLSSFDTCHFTRPMAILATNGMPSMALVFRSGQPLSDIPPACDLPVPPRFRFATNFLRNLIRFSIKREIRWVTVLFNSRK